MFLGFGIPGILVYLSTSQANTNSLYLTWETNSPIHLYSVQGCQQPDKQTYETHSSNRLLYSHVHLTARPSLPHERGAANVNKKSELMLMRCARSYSNQKSPKKITKKPLFWGSRSFKVIEVNTTKKHVTSSMISSTSVPICKRFHARQANSTKIATF